MYDSNLRNMVPKSFGQMIMNSLYAQNQKLKPEMGTVFHHSPKKFISKSGMPIYLIEK